MALEDKLAARSQPLLPPGSRIRHAFVCQTRPRPSYVTINFLTYFLISYRIVCITDDAIYVLRSSKLRLEPREVLAILPRRTQLGPVSGTWTEIQLMGQRHWVNMRFYRHIEDADYEAHLATRAPSQPPTGQVRIRTQPR